jgi:hypothetical protein
MIIYAQIICAMLWNKITVPWIHICRSLHHFYGLPL